MYNNQAVLKQLKLYEPDLKADLEKLIQIPSFRDESTSTKGKPFGKEIARAFQQMKAFAERDGFISEDFDGYAMHIEHGSNIETVGILAHLDVVEAGNQSKWYTPPFQLKEQDGFLYGRGVNDDKGPLLGAYYAMKIIKQLKLPMKRKVRLILGGAEETTWECMDYYFKKNSQPTFAFSPDGNFPIVNGEKGVIQGEVVYEHDLNFDTKKSAQHDLEIIELKSDVQNRFICERMDVTLRSKHPEKYVDFFQQSEDVEIEGQMIYLKYNSEPCLSRNPHKAENVIFKFIEDLIDDNINFLNFPEIKQIFDQLFLNDVYGKKLGIYMNDFEMGVTTFGIMYINYKNRKMKIGFDIRYPKPGNKSNLLKKMKAITEGFGLQIDIYKHKELLFVDENSELIVKLKQAYQNVMGEEAYCLTKGGMSYARTLQNGVAFGPSFPNDDPKPHLPNENIKLETLRRSILIYVETLLLLAND